MRLRSRRQRARPPRPFLGLGTASFPHERGHGTELGRLSPTPFPGVVFRAWHPWPFPLLVPAVCLPLTPPCPRVLQRGGRRGSSDTQCPHPETDAQGQLAPALPSLPITASASTPGIHKPLVPPGLSWPRHLSLSPAVSKLGSAGGPSTAPKAPESACCLLTSSVGV